MFEKAKDRILRFLISKSGYVSDSSSNTAQRDPKKSAVRRVNLRLGDVASKEFEEPEYDFEQIVTGYNTDSYIRQGIDKYVDQIFKEGYEFYGKNEQAIEYLKLRFRYMADVTGVPTEQLFVDIADDLVKFSNVIISKVRMKDPLQLPAGLTVTGVHGLEPVVGYFIVNLPTVSMRRDQYGVVLQYQQEVEGADKPVMFKPEDVIHIYYKKEKGHAFGAPFLNPVLDDVRALRQAEENVLRMMYRSIYPLHHVSVGDNNAPGTEAEIESVKDALDNMDIDGGLVTSNRVEVKPVPSDQVIDASPYIKHMEERVFTGMGIPTILWGRGDTANRSTGDNQSSEMNDRVKAMQRTICSFLNELMIQDLLLEGGFDPILNEDDNVIFRFKDNNADAMIKFENHLLFKYEHDAITAEELRLGLGLEPLTDRSQLKSELSAELSSRDSEGGGSSSPSSSSSNKNKPTNQHGTKSSPKKTSDALEVMQYTLNGGENN